MTALTRPVASEAVEHLGWRYLLGALSTSVGVTSVDRALAVAAIAVAACGSDGDHLRVDLRPDRVELTVQTVTHVSARDIELANGITDAVRDLGLDTVPSGPRPVQTLEIALDTMDVNAIRPFWKAVLAYEDEPGPNGPTDGLIDPVRQGPTIWFQQMDEPREQRNRIHFDITVPHDEADARVAAAIAAGGRLVSDTAARAFWILADAEGNEICVCTWQDRD